ncbi:alpha/beta hydrolase [Patescibacteria group bacterium]|nr:alpha/beta hydrolase [Patescibacteria group bacterium]
MEKPVVFKNKRGKQLIGILHIPRGKKKFPLVVICHGFGATKTRRRLVRLARVLAKKKIASFRFDFEGCGDSEGKLEIATVENETQDLDLALGYVLKQKNIDKKRMGFIAESFGAVVVLKYVVQNNFSAKTLVFWSPAFYQKKLIPFWHTKNDLKKWKKRGYLIRKDKKFGIGYLKENEKKDYTPLLSQVQIPILIIHGKKDETVPIKFSRQLVKDYKNIKLIALPKAGHKFDENYYIQKRLIQNTVRWLKNLLKN